MVLQKIHQVSIVDDDWNDAFKSLFVDAVKQEKPARYVEYDIDPLAYVVKWLESGTLMHDIHTWLEFNTPGLDGVTEEHLKKANEIRNFFKNSIMLRRLKGEFISSFMDIVDELNENIYKVNVEHIKILIKLPDFYRESAETRDLFAQYVSLDNTQNQATDVDDVWTFVKKIKRNSKHENVWRYYFANSKKNLMSVVVKSGIDSGIFLEYIASQGPVGIKGTGFHAKQPGWDFWFYRMSNYELYPVAKTTN